MSMKSSLSHRRYPGKQGPTATCQIRNPAKSAMVPAALVRPVIVAELMDGRP